jgi:transcription antitermination factor NusG
MPILPPEPDCNPLDLWAESAVIPAKNGAAWWCLHTKPRQEKSIARDLRIGGIIYYLPQMQKEGRTPQGRKLRSLIPCFPGYMFLYGDPDDRLVALRGSRLVNVLEVTDQDSLVRDLRRIHAVLSSGLPISPESTVPIGSTVRITTGPLMGLTGKVVRRGKRDHFVAIVDFLRRGAAVELQDWQVEPVDE